MTNVVIPVAESSSIGEARRAVARLAQSAALGETDAGRAAIVVNELATNLHRHVRGRGRILASAGRSGIDVWSIDDGPGMPDIERCFQDGFSTGGTPGNGLGAISRLSDEHDVYSAATGTVIWTRISAPVLQPPDRPKTAKPFRYGAISVPAPGEVACGDDWRFAIEGGRASLLVIDGLGHGPLAADAARAGCDAFDASPFEPPRPLIESMHHAMTATRGAAVAIAQVDPDGEKLRYAGIGNIAGTLLDAAGASRGLFSHNGTVGHQMRKVQEFEYPWVPGSMLVLHSDGLQTRWTLEKYPGLARRHPAVVAGVLYRDFVRGRDDVTVSVIAGRAPGGGRATS